MKTGAPTIHLPQLPEREILTDLCREVAATERLQPAVVEKDFYLTRLLWALGQWFGDGLLLKGGTLLSKVDLGFRRMSEDADFVIPAAASRYKGRNAGRLDEVRGALKALAPQVGLTLPFVQGQRSGQGTHSNWELPYASDFGPQKLLLEVSIRPVLRPARRTVLGQLIQDEPLLGSYEDAFCWSLAADEARAEKVRAACTREAIRDFYDLAQLLEAGHDFGSQSFVELVDAKLGEMGQARLAQQTSAFMLSDKRRARLADSLRLDLPGVLRVGEPPFDLDALVARFDALWSSLRAEQGS
ncbi:MAG: nucleotidyl transferase AbiEii/AbiGii toxin family protein [Myxococcaceae bacterium]